MSKIRLEIPYKILQSKGNQNIVFYLRDCKIGMQECIKDKSVDVVVTSPPYNTGQNYNNNYRDNLSRDDYLQWIGDVCIEIKRVLKDDGSFFLNIGNKPSDEWMTWSMEGRLKGHFSLLARIIWAKSLSVNKSDVPNDPNITGDISIGQRRPIHSNRFFTNNYEFIDLFTKTKDIELDKLAIGVPYQDKSNTSRWKSTNNKDVRELDKIWFIPYETIQSKSERVNHPSPFPVKLPEMCIKLHGLAKKDNFVVLDPFCGIGSTAVACKRLGVSFIGFDTQKPYLDEAIARVTKESA